jgi:hypothetical protein
MTFSKYNDSMIKINNLKNRFILIQQYTGFGNKVFDCIIGIYLKYNYGYDIYYVDTITKHNKLNDPLVSDIFLKIKNEFILISDNEGDYIKFILKNKKINFKKCSLEHLHEYINNDRNIINTPNLYYLVGKMYNSFNNEIKNIFTINKSLIDPKIIELSKKIYAVVHIRYGDKLEYSLKLDDSINLEKEFTYTIFTPKYYYNQIKKLKNLIYQ